MRFKLLPPSPLTLAPAYRQAGFPALGEGRLGGLPPHTEGEVTGYSQIPVFFFPSHCPRSFFASSVSLFSCSEYPIVHRGYGMLSSPSPQALLPLQRAYADYSLLFGKYEPRSYSLMTPQLNRETGVECSVSSVE
jgi:hypothetical protein